MRTRATHVVHLADQRRSRTDSHGIVTFSLGLTRALPSALGPGERLVVLVNDELAAELGTDFLRSGDDVRVVRAPSGLGGRLALDHVRVLRMARAAEADSILYPKGFVPWWPGRPGARQVVCLHDDIPFLQRDDPRSTAARRRKARYFCAAIRRSMRVADRRIFVSDFSRRRLVARVGPGRPDDLVVHQGLSTPEVAYVPVARRARQAVVFGSMHPHKRVSAGVDLLAADASARPVVDRVVVVGPWPDGRTTVGELAVEHRARPLAPHDLAALVAESRLVLFPSEYEGFGLPPIEALAAGTPVVHRRSDAVREAVGEEPGGYETEAPEPFGRALAAALALGDDELRDLRRRMRARFTWTAAAEAVAGALRGADTSVRDA